MKKSFKDSALLWALFSLPVLYFGVMAASIYEEGMTERVRAAKEAADRAANTSIFLAIARSIVATYSASLSPKAER